jgi:hypothetical protein
VKQQLGNLLQPQKESLQWALWQKQQLAPAMTGSAQPCSSRSSSCPCSTANCLSAVSSWLLRLTWQGGWHSSWAAATAVLAHRTSSSSKARSWAVSRVCCYLWLKRQGLLLQQMKQRGLWLPEQQQQQQWEVLPAALGCLCHVCLCSMNSSSSSSSSSKATISKNRCYKLLLPLSSSSCSSRRQEAQCQVLLLVQVV